MTTDVVFNVNNGDRSSVENIALLIHQGSPDTNVGHLYDEAARMKDHVSNVAVIAIVTSIIATIIVTSIATTIIATIIITIIATIIVTIIHNI